MVDWTTALLSIMKTIKKEPVEIDPQYLAIKPAFFSDHNQLRALAALRVVLRVIPPTQVLSSVLGLGETGFQIWKAIALRKDYKALTFPPIGLNTLIFLVESDAALHAHFGHLIKENLPKLKEVHNDFSFITEEALLRFKYPDMPLSYIQACCERNLTLLGKNLYKIEQVLESHKNTPEVDANLREAMEAIKNIFPSMRNWALLNSKTFDQVLEVLDTLV